MEVEDIQILNTSDRAAEFRTDISGWVDRHGRFWGRDEHMARWSGCTHLICPECGKVMSKNYTLCRECREKKSVERYKARESKPWDGVTPLYSETADEYFFSQDNLIDYLHDHNCTIQSLRLLICSPIRLREVDDDYFCDDLPEDGELPSDVADALEDLNSIIRDQAPVAWFPGKHAAIIESGGEEE